MSAPTGNTYAERWSLERTLQALKDIDSFSRSHDCLYLGHALSLAGYYDDIWAYWRRKWRTTYEVIHQMKIILQRFEVRIYRRMVDKTMPVRAAEFALRHHYGWGREDAAEQLRDLKYIENEPEPQPQPKSPELIEAEHEQEIEERIASLRKPDTRTTEISHFYQQKINEYNKANPHDPIVTAAAYFDGPPPDGLPAILFGDGYFLKVNT